MFEPLIYLRAIHFAAVIVVAGTIAFDVLVAQRVQPLLNNAAIGILRRRYATLLWLALALAALSATGWLLRLTSNIYGAGIADVLRQGGIWVVAGETRFGQNWVLRAVMMIVISCGVAYPPKQPLLSAALVLLACALPVSLAWVGHAGAADGILRLAADALHILAAAVWLGGLPAFVLLVAAARGGQSPAQAAFAAARRFSLIAIAAVALLLTSGIINTWLAVDDYRQLYRTDYGRLILLKLALFAAMMVFAAGNRLSLRALRPATLGRLHRNTLAEIVLGFGALVAVGALGIMSPPNHVHAAPISVPEGAAYTHIHGETAMADVTIAPGRTGPVEITIHLSQADFAPLAAKTVMVKLSNPKAGTAPISIPARMIGDGDWRAGPVDLGDAGVWTVEVDVAPTGAPPVALDAPIMLEPGR